MLLRKSTCVVESSARLAISATFMHTPPTHTQLGCKHDKGTGLGRDASETRGRVCIHMYLDMKLAGGVLGRGTKRFLAREWGLQLMTKNNYGIDLNVIW